MVDGRCYPHDLLIAAIHTVTLERLEAMVPEGASPRAAAKAVLALKTEQAHRAVMNEALRRVAESGLDVPIDEALRDADGLPVAAFPKRLDNRNEGH